MTSQQILQSDLLDILFEKRNKMYGAYRLRRNYPVELTKALGFMALLVIALFFLSGPSEKEPAFVRADKSYELTNIVIPQEAKPELPKPKIEQAAASQQVKTEVFTNQMKVLEVSKDPVVTQDNLSTALVGSSRLDGPVSTGVPLPPTPPVSGGTGTGEPEVEKEEPPVLPSRQPQFPGGAQAWLDFLSRHLRPPLDMEPGEKRSCLIRFSVDEEGAITNFQVVQSGGSEFDNEVIRVLKKMPRWLPAIQNGRPTAVSFTQPVTFVAQEE